MAKVWVMEQRHEMGWRGEEGVKSTGLGDLCDKD